MTVCLWSGPRNISTALMYAFAQRRDARVIDEPLYGHYLRVTGAAHPGRDEILRQTETDGAKVISDVILRRYDEDVVFIKQMTHHLVELDTSFLEHVTNVFLIRNPKNIIASYARVLPNPTLADIGIAQQHRLFKRLSTSGDLPLVLDATEVLADPEGVLRNTCHTLGVTFDPGMLTWPAGPRPEDGVWARYWYKNVHHSTGFVKQATSDRPLPTYLEPLYEEALPYYRELYRYAVKARDKLAKS